MEVVQITDRLLNYIDDTNSFSFMLFAFVVVDTYFSTSIYIMTYMYVHMYIVLF